jgi:hypothetical protein
MIFFYYYFNFQLILLNLDFLKPKKNKIYIPHIFSISKSVYPHSFS